MDCVSRSPEQEATDAGTRISYPCVPSQAKPACRLGSRSFAAQDIKHAAKRVSINICINTNALATAKINLDHAGFSASGSDRRQRRLCQRRRQDTRRQGWRRGELDRNQTWHCRIASPSTLASFRQAKISPRETPCLRATSETFAPVVKLFSMIRAFSSSDQRRRRSTPSKISAGTGVYPILRTSLRSHLRRSTKTDKAVKIGCIPLGPQFEIATIPDSGTTETASATPAPKSSVTDKKPANIPEQPTLNLPVIYFANNSAKISL